VELTRLAFAHFDGNAIAVVPQCAELAFESFQAGPSQWQRVDIEFDVELRQLRHDRKPSGGSSESPIAAEDPPSHDTLVNFVRPVVNPRPSFMPPEVGEDRIIGHSQGAVRLKRAVDHAHQNAG
jgi:hypothetical protein